MWLSVRVRVTEDPRDLTRGGRRRAQCLTQPLSGGQNLAPALILPWKRFREIGAAQRALLPHRHRKDPAIAPGRKIENQQSKIENRLLLPVSPVGLEGGHLVEPLGRLLVRCHQAGQSLRLFRSPLDVARGAHSAAHF